MTEMRVMHYRRLLWNTPLCTTFLIGAAMLCTRAMFYHSLSCINVILSSEKSFLEADDALEGTPRTCKCHRWHHFQASPSPSYSLRDKLNTSKYPFSPNNCSGCNQDVSPVSLHTATLSSCKSSVHPLALDTLPCSK
ncbi:hypothetical protein B0T14DRAFT_16441 [Immersiella caudata]|uniref:Uncharacterized protein n=1 Tax=Immersiella caudata TaxID=314043 RepID=A0AA39XEJ5_9PEZI|nr:hypothetical protein B0T14DRAFT_16441 [Immersiella caudata]